MKHEQEAYAKSFPSTWLSAANAPPGPAEPAPSPESRSKHSPRSSLPELESDASSNIARDSWEGDTVGDSASSDAALDPWAQHGNGSSVSTPRHSADERRGAIAKTQDARLTVYKSRRPATRTRAVSAPASEYSTVYPASWTIARPRDVPQPSSAAVLPAPEPPSKPATAATTAAANVGSMRSTSTTSREDVGPVSPMRRRLQRDFQSMSHPSPPPRKPDPRAMSVDASRLDRMRRVLGKSDLAAYAERPVQSAAEMRLSTPGRHESSNSNYSTVERAPTPSQRVASSDDAPADHRSVSMAYSQYGSGD